MTHLAIRGVRCNTIYIDEYYYGRITTKERVKFLNEALKYCKHSKKQHQIKKKLKMWENMMAFSYIN